ncbi:MAG: CRTAC1 family protein [Deltaproteobacteria bacterium]|nr:CRTAC1 family protein [Deltaproteobacteria bacterium]
MGYAPGARAFEEATQGSGLEGVEAALLSVADLNGDGWPDLVARRGGTRADVLEGEAVARHVWVLMNRGAAAAGGGARFEDATEASGFLATRGAYPARVGRPSWVVVFGDVDNDGDVDAYSGVDMRTPPAVTAVVGGEERAFVVDQERSELLLNDGAGRFALTYAQDPVRRVGVEDVPSGAAFTDVDRDGWLDLWVSQGGLGAPMQDVLFRNAGRGELEDATAALGLRTQPWEQLAALNGGLAHSTAWSAAACDLNDDGTPELLAASYGRAPNHLWLGERDAAGAVRYLNRSVASGYAYDGDRSWQDNQFARCYCEANPSADGCAGAPASLLDCGQMNWRHESDRQPFRLGGNSGATVCEDWDGDGDLDLYTTEIRHWWAGEGSDASEVLLNDGAPSPTFARPGRAALGLTIAHDEVSWDEGHITAAAIDFDNDGLQDIYLGGTDYPGNRGRLYRNRSTPEGARFEEVPTADFFEHNRSHGVAVADFDRDGDLDVVVGHSRARCSEGPNPCYPTAQARYFRNVVGAQRSWLQLSLEGGAGSNRGAVGARVEVTPVGAAGARAVARVAQGGYGHFGQQQDPALHFGLGEACEADVRVVWPNAARAEQRFRVRAGARYRLRQGEAPRPAE